MVYKIIVCLRVDKVQSVSVQGNILLLPAAPHGRSQPLDFQAPFLARLQVHWEGRRGEDILLLRGLQVCSVVQGDL